MKKLRKAAPYIILLAFTIIFFFIAYYTTNTHTASPIMVTESDTLLMPDTSQAKVIDSLKEFTVAAVQQLHKYEALRKEYEQQESIIIKETKIDSSGLAALRKRLSEANNEISRLHGEIATLTNRRNVVPLREVISYVQPEIITPDENSIVIQFDGRSKNGDIYSDRLVVYLLEYGRRAKKYMQFDTSCDEKLYGSTQAGYYNGVYFFNNVQPGRYLIKVCTYYGNFKVVNKQAGKLNVTMQIAPPLQ